MSISTWLTEEEKPRLSKVADEELNELFQEIRAIDPRFYIQEYDWFEWEKFLGFIVIKQIKHTFYTLYICHGIDAQVMNFAPVNSNTSINTGASKGVLMNFFFGFLAGHKVAPK